MEIEERVKAEVVALGTLSEVRAGTNGKLLCVDG